MQGLTVEDRTVLITGSNRGIGKSFAIQALKMGARKVYATARDPAGLADAIAPGNARLVTLPLDVTSQTQVDAVATAAPDVDILINNAGMGGGGPITANADESGKRREMDVNYFGIMKMAIAFAPILKANWGGAIINILSVAGLCNFPFAPGYSASKAAGHSLTQALRAELEGQNTLVAGVYPGPVDTDMAKDLPFDKVSPDSVTIRVFSAVAEGEEDIFPDPFAVEFHRQLLADRKALEKAIAAGLQ